eukprot:scaffold766_cov210-Alexandrium_tamarense.AAC.7
MSTGEEGMSYRKGLAGGRSVILPEIQPFFCCLIGCEEGGVQGSSPSFVHIAVIVFLFVSLCWSVPSRDSGSPLVLARESSIPIAKIAKKAFH